MTQTTERPRRTAPVHPIVQTAFFAFALTAAILAIRSGHALNSAGWGFTTGIIYTYAVRAWMGWWYR